MESTGKVTPHKVAPSEPTIDTTLITIAIAGNNENRNTANACVATTNMHDPEHDVVSEDAHDTKDNRIREQFAHHRHEHIHPCRLQPFIACPELDLATDSVHRNQQNDHLEKDK